MFNYLEKNRSQKEDKTNIIFTNFKTFELRLKKILKTLTRKEQLRNSYITYDKKN